MALESRARSLFMFQLLGFILFSDTFTDEVKPKRSINKWTTSYRSVDIRPETDRKAEGLTPEEP